MSVSPISSGSALYSSEPPAVSPSKASNTPTQSAVGSSSASPSSSTEVTLSGDAEAYARLAASGVTVTQQSLAEYGMQPRAVGESAADYASSIFGAIQKTLSAHPQAAITQKDFEALVANFGATAAQADHLFSQIDTGNTGSVTDAQLLGALGGTQTDPDSATSQMLMTIMDTDHDGGVSGAEFEKFESAMVDTERGLAT